MALHAFDLLGVVSDQAEVLAVGSALEPAVRWLTPRTRRVCHLAEATSPLQPDRMDASFGVIFCSGAIERLAGLRWHGLQCTSSTACSGREASPPSRRGSGSTERHRDPPGGC